MRSRVPVPHVFVSHSSADAALADAIRAHLEACGVPCWIAPRDIRPGAVWSEAILEGIREARALVLVASAASMASDHVLREVNAAATAGHAIVPLRIDDAQLTGPLEYYVSTTHWTTWTTPPDPAQAAALVTRLATLVGVVPRAAGAHAARRADGGAREERKTVSAVAVELTVAGDGVEAVDPEDAAAAVEPLLERLAARLADAGAATEAPAGHGLSAVFGAPAAHEDDAERAALCLLAVRDEVAGAAERDPWLGLALRAGIATGEALVRLGDGAPRVTGDPPGAATRLAARAAAGEILVDRATEALLRRPAELAPDGDAFRLVGWRARFGVDADHEARAPLVGRDRELAVLVDALDRAVRDEAPQLVTLIGQPGIGKTRLVAELSAHVDRLPELVYWRQGRSLPFGDGITFWALGEMVKAHAGVLDTDDAATAEAKLAAALEPLDLGDDAPWVLRHLRPLLGLGGDGTDASDTTEAFAAWRAFFEALAADGPAVLVFDDIHWADEQLLDFIDHLVDWAVGAPLLVVATARPELLDRRPSWGGGKLAATTLRLAPLAEADAAVLIDALLADVELPDGVRAAIRERCEGNPLYAEEYVQMLRDGDLLGAGGAATADELPLPVGVAGVIAARLDLLPQAEKALGHDASVVGKVVWPGAVEAVGGYGAGEAERTMLQLVRRDVMRKERRSSVAGEAEFAFRHPLVREVAYGQIPRAGRARRHAAVADWLERLPSDRAEERVEMLAHHYREALRYARAARLDEAEVRGQAVRALAGAGERAASLHAHAAAARYLGEALELAGPDAPERPRLLLGAGRAAFHAERGGTAELAEARALLAAAGDRRGAAEAETLLGRLAWEAGGVEEARARYAAALDLVREEGVCREKVVVLAALSAVQMAADENDASIATGRAALTMAEGLGLEELAARVLVDIGVTRALTGDTGGLDDLERAVGILTRISSPELARAHTNYAAAWLAQIDLVRAREHLEEAERAAQRFGDRAELRWLRGELALARYREGRWDEALALADAAIRESEAGSPHYLDGLCRGVRARIRLARGDGDGAAVDAAAALAAARTAGDAQVLVPALALCARVLAEVGRPEAARPLTEELAGAAPRSLHSCDECGIDLAVALARFDAAAGFLAAADALAPPLAWVDAAAAVARGDLAAAVDAYTRIGSAPDEAWARLRHAERLAAEGRVDEADAVAAPALAFLGGVGADAPAPARPVG